MEDLKNINSKDEDEGEAIKFLTEGKWEEYSNDETGIIKSAILKVINPITNKEEEKLAISLEATFDKPASSLLKLLNDINIRKNFDTLYNNSKILSTENPSENITIMKLYFYLKMGFVFSDRDFVVQRKIWSNFNGVKDSSLYLIKSINHPDYPEKDKPVRGIFYKRACYVKPIDNNNCSMILRNIVEMQMPNFSSYLTLKEGAKGVHNWIVGLRKYLI